MAKRISWMSVTAGEMIRFRYKAKHKNAKSRIRTCLVLNERHIFKRKTDGRKVRLVHMLQMEAIPRKTGTTKLRTAQIKRILKRAANLGLEYRTEGEEKRIAVKGARQRAPRQYRRITNVIKQHGIYRTFSWHRLKRRAAFRASEFPWPQELVEELKGGAPPINEAEADIESRDDPYISNLKTATDAIKKAVAHKKEGDFLPQLGRKFIELIDKGKL
jgi:hypothetical protein